MRIESYSKVQPIYDTKKNSKVNQVKVNNALDQVDISDMGKSVQIAKQAIGNASDVREELVSSIKERMQSGTYEVSSESFADKLMQAHEQQKELFNQ